MSPKTLTNQFGQPVGRSIDDWRAARLPEDDLLTGHWGQLERLDCSKHAKSLFAAIQLAPDSRNWTYLPYGPFEKYDDYQRWLESVAGKTDPCFYAVISPTGEALGVASLMRIDPDNGVIEIGHIHLACALQRTPLATQALSLLIAYAFELGNRRVEWKCDSLNRPSRAAAERLGFQLEGEFRQARISKNRNRNTTWYSMLDEEWPDISVAHRQWLAPDNFDARGRQRQSLREMIGNIRAGDSAGQ